MKSIHTIITLALLLTFHNYSQEKIHRGIIPGRLTAERLLEMHQSNSSCLQELNERETLLLKSDISNMRTVLGNQQGKFFEGEELETKDTRTTIKKIILSNGYLLIEEINQSWEGSSWVNFDKSSYIYDGNNNRTEYLYQDWNSTDWVNYSKYSYAYDGNNNQTEELYQYWDLTAWVNSNKFSFTYDGNNNLTESVFLQWNVSAWVNFDKSSYIYDANNNRTEYLHQIWDVSAWVNYSMFSFTFDGNNNTIEALGQIWDGSGWVNRIKTSYIYVPVTAINEEVRSLNSYSLSNNYPNPFNPSTRISYTIPEKSNVSLKIFNLLGSEVAELVKGETEAGKYNINFNASNLPSGVYFYRLQAGSFVETKKMLYLK